ncbi:MAG: hypothetical protein F9K44_05880 [Hyphomicrobiaceae bacterium]|nr:MAG: hypothetical protein F9K44_05880 [Hyphomicrobiaceae bacterium]
MRKFVAIALFASALVAVATVVPALYAHDQEDSRRSTIGRDMMGMMMSMMGQMGQMGQMMDQCGQMMGTSSSRRLNEQWRQPAPKTPSQ